MAGELTAKEKVVGLKQTRRAVSQADCSLTMQQLGRACGIAVSASAVAIVAQ